MLRAFWLWFAGGSTAGAVCACGAVKPLAASAAIAPSLPIAATAAFLALSTIGLVVAVVERRAAWIRRFGLWLLWTHLDPEDVGRHTTRALLLQAIQKHNGQATKQLAYALERNEGTCLYHLRVLERAGKVRSRRQGRERIWEPIGAAPSTARDLLRDPSRNAILEFVKHSPGSSLSETSRALGLAPSTVHHHVSALVQANLLRVLVLGKRRQLYRA